MKYLILSAIALLAFSSCKKSSQASGGNSSVLGHWNLVLLTGGIAGIHETAVQWGHAKSYMFGTDNKGTVTYDKVTDALTYTTTVEYSKNYQKNVNYLYLNDTDKYIISFRNDTMNIDMDAVVDGVTEVYVRE